MSIAGAIPASPKDRFVTVIVDLTPVRDRSGPARLIDMVEGRSARVFQAWLDAQPDTFRNTVQVVGMDGFTGFKTAAAQAVPDATTVMDPFHVCLLYTSPSPRDRTRS